VSLDLKGRIPELDGIRGIAIGMVLLHHYFYGAIQARPATALSYALLSGRLTWSGVDLFFVLSGFLIGGILLDARESTNYFRVFYTRRFFRIVPIYFLCLVGAASLAYVIRSVHADGMMWMLKDHLPWIPYPFFLQNFWMATRTTFGMVGLGVTWSLAVEEQFYLTLPLLVRILNPRNLVLVVTAGIVAAPILRVAFHAFWPDHHYSWVVIMVCRADALLLGVLGAIAMRSAKWRDVLARNREAFRVALAVLAAGFAYMTWRAADPYGLVMLRVGFTWLALLYLSVLLYGLLFRDGWISRCLRWSWLKWLGSIAYGTYLLHELVRGLLFGVLLSRTPQIASISGLMVSLLALGITLITCQLSWRYFEKPLIKRGHRAHYKFGETEGTPVLATLSVEGSSS
jgi:peptidoglycan/LPS O-acetylase OafA/YrhL